MQLGQFIKFKQFSADHFLRKGDLILINVCVWKVLTGQAFANDLEKLKIRVDKQRPLVILKVVKNNAYYVALSTDDYAIRGAEVTFDLSRCDIGDRCKDFGFKKKAYIYVKEKKVKGRYGAKNILLSFTADLQKLSYLLEDSDTLNVISKYCQKRVDSIYDVFYFCANCDKEYIEKFSEGILNG
ncbi:hypothetical protein [Calditerrivibrio nitroreducens]|uniref:Uncharacterized protein n=1 Tax=Calditerrivibrio nitroreducens (strain DSM 19672 / NBRC 101217 / Yu37-1) TaxID=768670 RepID=E4TFE2_CALNY|nr:hypothetical protein [Calditerrivibrio nitroreducens]ADR19515.1 hypothetical protein Calni_1607 [Calditerrivibrio nitroreducens DSM 19672]